MGLTDNLLVGVGAALLAARAKAVFEDAREERRRTQSPLRFDDFLTREEFSLLAEGAARRTPRVTSAVVTGMTVELHVRSNSGLSTWKARVDFNDYGSLTGTYWVRSENDDSLVPAHFGDELQREVRLRVGDRGRDDKTVTSEHSDVAATHPDKPRVGRWPNSTEIRAEVRRRVRRIGPLR